LEAQEFVQKTLPEIQRQQQEQAEWYKQRQGTVTQDNRNWLQRKIDNIAGTMANDPSSLYNTVPMAMAIASGPAGWKALGTGILAGTAVNYATKKLTGETLGDVWGDVLGINPNAADMIVNPGYWFGGLAGARGTNYAASRITQATNNLESKLFPRRAFGKALMREPLANVPEGFTGEL